MRTRTRVYANAKSGFLQCLFDEILQKITNFCIFLQENLHISKIFCNFASSN